MATIQDYQRQLQYAMLRNTRRDTLIHGDILDMAQEQVFLRNTELEQNKAKRRSFFARLLKATKRVFKKKPKKTT